MKHMRQMLVAIMLCGATLVSAGYAAEAAPQVWLVPLQGAVGPASVDLVIRTIQEADDANADAVVIRMDTPGGLDKSMRDLIRAILAADLPVITYVSPDGARAASAGTYIAYASHIAAMSPASNIGSSTPVSIAPTAPKSPIPSSEDGDDGESQGASGDAMTRKIVNDAVAYLQGLAELRGRNIEWAERTVRDGANLRASEALEQNVIDLIATDLDTLLSAVHGRTVKIGSSQHTLNTDGADVIAVEVDWRHELLSIITDPSIAYGLLIIGVYGLILEFYNPGMIFPSVLGIICLLLGAYGLQMLPVNYAGVALILLGIGMMVGEVMTPTVGVLGVGGLVAFVLGSVLLFDSNTPGYDLPVGLIAAVAAASGAITFFVVGAAMRARHQPVVTGISTMIGARATVLEDFEVAGTVRVAGETWQAQSNAPVEKGDTVTIESIDGLTLTVAPFRQSKAEEN